MSAHTDSSRLRKFLLTAGIVAAAILVPVAAMAVPGSGEFVSVDSVSGRDITELYNIIAKVCLVLLLIVEGVLFVAIIKFRRRSDDEQPKQVHGDLRLELGWTLAAAIVQVYIGFITIDTMFEVETIPDTEMTVEAIGYQWDWEFRYPDQGGMVHEDLVVPANTNIRLEVTSRDVIHSLFIPELGIKIDAVPGRFNYFWFNADGPINQPRTSDHAIHRASNPERFTTRDDWWKYFTLDFLPTTEDRFYIKSEDTGQTNLDRRVAYLSASRDASASPYAKYNAVEYRGMCTELCGKGHYDMYFRTVAMTDSDFQQWVTDKKSGGNGEVNGEQLFNKNCSTCHGENGAGTPGAYPPLDGSRFTNKKELKKKHIEIVLGGLDGELTVQGQTYNGVMQPFGQKLTNEQVAALVTHERTSWGNSGGKVTADLVAEVRKRPGLPDAPAGGSQGLSKDDLVASGKRVYQACAGCHGNDGAGVDDIKSLTENPTVISNVAGSVDLLTNQAGTHPAMGRSMSNRQIAGVLTYIRNSFGNEASAVQPKEVNRIRNQSK